MNQATSKLRYQPFLAVSLIAALVLVSLGSRSLDFHHWMHGDSAHCALTHHDGSAPDHGSDSSGDEDQIPDPLQPFCQSGGLFQAVPCEPFLDSPRWSGFAAWPHFTFRSEDSFLSSAPRAPPCLV